jgi:DNA gyrase inhibitor GyrI/AraC-like DNA-binding protein
MQNKTNKTQEEYIKRINNVMVFIENNLDQGLSLDDLSGKVFFSSYHFHRVFSAIVGETLNSFIIRKRIERIAAIIAVGTDVPLVELAYQYCFSSASSFSRAFKKFYGTSPTLFMQTKATNNSKIGIEPITPDQYLYRNEKFLTWMKMNAKTKIKELPEMVLAGIMHIGQPDKISFTYERLFKWVFAKGISNFPDLKAVTIYHDNPRITEPSKVRQSACVTIGADQLTDGEIIKTVIPRGYYAVGNFNIKPALFQKAWESMCVWVIENGFSFRDGSYFEIYHNDSRSHPEQKFIVDICIPVEAVNPNIVSRNKPEKTLSGYHDKYKRQIEIGDIPKAYQGLLAYMRGLRNYFIRNYPVGFIAGSLYSGEMTISYFPFTPVVLKEKKLKIAIVFNHQNLQFEIWLAGQNRQIQKKYWEIFNHSDWDKYHIPSSPNEGFSIVDHILVEHPNFDDLEALTDQIETKAMEFIVEIQRLLS